MHPLSSYNVYIFDCDGVLLDSNELKIQAMEQTLVECLQKHDQIAECLIYFKKNFGISRFKHVRVFVDKILALPKSMRETAYEKLLHTYSEKCKKIYLKAELTPEILPFLQSLNGKRFVASGSDQNELIDIFHSRQLDIYFEKILGSPQTKTHLVSNILKETGTHNALLFGDSISDLKAAIDNSIDFIAYLPYSNVKNELRSESLKQGFCVANSWRDIQ